VNWVTGDEGRQKTTEDIVAGAAAIEALAKFIEVELEVFATEAVIGANVMTARRANKAICPPHSFNNPKATRHLALRTNGVLFFCHLH
jgi:hypothetical protein